MITLNRVVKRVTIGKPINISEHLAIYGRMEGKIYVGGGFGWLDKNLCGQNALITQHT